MMEFKYTDILSANKKQLKELDGEQPYRIRILSNITCNQLGEILKYNLYMSRISAIVEIGEYDNIVQDSQSCDGYDLVVVHYDLMTILEKRKDFVESFSETDLSSFVSSVKSELGFIFCNLQRLPSVIVSSFSDAAIYQNAVTNTKMFEIVNELNRFVYGYDQTNLKIVNIGTILGRVGIANAVNVKLYALSKTLYSAKFWMEYSYAIAPLICKVKGKLKKAVIFDCDNTLWKGILGEDGFDGIDMSVSSKIGYYYSKVQQIAHWLARQGVIIGLCSKNNLNDVEEIIENHPDFILSNDDIVIKKVNWIDKATNIKQIASDLNIGTDSIVFIDDSDFEISLINQELPEVLTFQVPANIINYPDQLLDIVNRYFVLEGSQADMERTLQYKQQAMRTEEKSKYTSIDSYLESLNLHVLIRENDTAAIKRIAQLTQKTNQFNVTTYRYTEEQIKDFMNNHKVLSVSVSDKFGDSGMTGVVIYTLENDVAVIDSFIMSCRIMGRNIEKAIMNYVIDTLEKQGVVKVVAKYVPTKKNMPVKDLYDMFNFSITAEYSGEKGYELLVCEYKKQNVDYIKIN